jgi:HSP90 family molecular chaperone
MSSNMKMMMAMMSQGGMSPEGGFNMNNLAKDSTLELNAAHPIIVNLNQLRKTNKEAASLVAK